MHSGIDCHEPVAAVNDVTSRFIDDRALHKRLAEIEAQGSSGQP